MTRPGHRLTDRELFYRLLRFAKLKNSEVRVFKGWLDKLTSNAMAELLPTRRLWVESIYFKQNIGELRASARRRARAAEQEKKESASFASTRLPKKPPGR